VQAVWPEIAWYVPDGHNVHCGPPFKPNAPGLHRQFALSLLPSGEVDNSGQAAQFAMVSDPRTSEYVPGRHNLHATAAESGAYLPFKHRAQKGPPPGPDDPGKHVQSLSASLAAKELELAGHD